MNAFDPPHTSAWIELQIGMTPYIGYDWYGHHNSCAENVGPRAMFLTEPYCVLFRSSHHNNYDYVYISEVHT